MFCFAAASSSSARGKIRGENELTVHVMDSRLDMFFNALTQKSSHVMIPAARG